MVNDYTVSDWHPLKNPQWTSSNPHQSCRNSGHRTALSWLFCTSWRGIQNSGLPRVEQTACLYCLAPSNWANHIHNWIFQVDRWGCQPSGRGHGRMASLVSWQKGKQHQKSSNGGTLSWNHQSWFHLVAADWEHPQANWRVSVGPKWFESLSNFNKSNKRNWNVQQNRLSINLRQNMPLLYCQEGKTPIQH